MDAITASERLRERAAVLRAETVRLLGESSTASIRQRLSSLLTVESLAEVRLRLEEIIRSLPNSDERQIALTMGPIVAEVNDGLAMLAEAMSDSSIGRGSVAVVKRRGFKNAINRAAATGNWGQFDELVNQYVEDATAGAASGDSSGTPTENADTAQAAAVTEQGA